MTQLVVESTIRVDPEFLRSARRSFEDALGARPDIWCHAENWHRLPESDSPDQGAWELGAEADARVVRLLTESRDSDEPRCTTTAAEEMLLAIPLPGRCPTPLVATAVFDGISQEILVRLARLCRARWDDHQELISLRLENLAFLRQVTADFEELTYLRGMAELLEISDLTFGLFQMAEKLLPMLRPLVDCEALVLVPASTSPDGPTDGRESNHRRVMYEGDLSVPDETCARLVDRYRGECRQQPVVKNHFRKMPGAEAFPGVTDFIIVPIVNGDLTAGWLMALNRDNSCNPMCEDNAVWEDSYLEFGTHEATLLNSTASILATHSRNVDLFREREHLLISMVRALVSAIDAKDEYTRGHSERVAMIGKRIAEEHGLDTEQCQGIYLSGLLHDVGKIGVRDAVLRKPGRLDAEEFAEIQRHPDQGWSILADLQALCNVLPGVLYHHERFDGQGYPDGLTGHDIPVAGRILAVADAYDAMTSDRPYRKGMPHEKAAAIIRDAAGTQWDPDIVDTFFRVIPDIHRICDTYRPPKLAQRRQGSVRKLPPADA